MVKRLLLLGLQGRSDPGFPKPDSSLHPDLPAPGSQAGVCAISHSKGQKLKSERLQELQCHEPGRNNDLPSSLCKSPEWLELEESYKGWKRD